MKLHKIAAALFIAVTLSTAVPASLGTPFAVTAEAHHHGWSGGYNHGGYYSHHGYDAHLHPNGMCPYGVYGNYGNTVPTASADAAALYAQQQAALLAQQQQAALYAQQQQVELLAQQQQAALLAQQQQAALLAQQQMATIVMQTQAALKQLGFYAGEVNGVLDMATQQALILFQTSYGLTVDGSINAQTITLLNIR
ncbi:peptidoglycan-binding protein [bacterium C-53]|nr:peptidoglycan-binding protein [Lachnospiraceae bacterium]NBI01450.1 peptidoglycan-binding protein [Lachnospiraceae bacterium]RKJ12762.1 peptidoglycan-binding protein [bacterium C-53]